MRILIVICDVCHTQIVGAIHKLAEDDGDFHSECLASVRSEEACQHEDNISDQAAGRSTARLICKQCGYDREEAVA